MLTRRAAVHLLGFPLLGLALLSTLTPPARAADAASALSSRLSQSLPELRKGVCGSAGQVFALRRGEEIMALSRRDQADRENPGRRSASREDDRWKRERLEAIANERDLACRVRLDGLGAAQPTR